MKTIEQKRIEGEIRNEGWRSLTPQQQLDDINRRLGVNKGAKRQREKLNKLINGEK